MACTCDIMFMIIQQELQMLYEGTFVFRCLLMKWEVFTVWGIWCRLLRISKPELRYALFKEICEPDYLSHFQQTIWPCNLFWESLTPIIVFGKFNAQLYQVSFFFLLIHSQYIFNHLGVSCYKNCPIHEFLLIIRAKHFWTWSRRPRRPFIKGNSNDFCNHARIT